MLEGILKVCYCDVLSVEEQIMQIIQSECCQAQVDRIRHSALRVGAIWHIYSATDAGKIREFLNKVRTKISLLTHKML